MCLRQIHLCAVELAGTVREREDGMNGRFGGENSNVGFEIAQDKSTSFTILSGIDAIDQKQ